jgi:tetratricopeptide (TPR) repeat protein
VALRTATLRHDDDGQAGLICLLLRNYLDANLYEQAAKLIARAAFPENASNNDWARYLYYLGRISAVQLQYADAHTHLEQALRKAPQNSAPGFIQAVCVCLRCVNNATASRARVPASHTNASHLSDADPPPRRRTSCSSLCSCCSARSPTAPRSAAQSCAARSCPTAS